MALYIGIDESMMRFRRSKTGFIYVASFSRDPTTAREEQKESRKGIFAKQRTSEIDINGLEGFLFYIFCVDYCPEFKRKIKENVRNANSELIITMLNLLRNNGVLNGDEIKIKIDGADMYGIYETLIEKLREHGYLGRTAINFVHKGDEKIKIINIADAIANSLRDYFTGEGEMIRRIQASQSPRIKKIIPFYMMEKGYLQNLERRVA